MRVARNDQGRGSARLPGRNSTGTSCCTAFRIMLASSCMMNLSNPKPQWGRPAGGAIFRWPREERACSRLLTFDSRLLFLIANDMHSRQMLSHCKHSTYEFLIANEIQRAALTLPALSLAEGSAVEGSFAQPQAPTLDSQLLTFNSADFQRSAFN